MCGYSDPIRFLVKNSFIHVIDENPVSPRPRALSEFTGSRMILDEELHRGAWSFPSLSYSARIEDAGSGSNAPVDVAPDASLFDRSEADDRTTVMMRNIPNAYTSQSFVELFDDQGFHGSYNFVYLPIDFRSGMNLGYAFMNFVSHDDAQLFITHFNGFKQWMCQSPKVGEVTWTDPHQGLEEHVERYRNSPVMHEDVSDIFKPRIYLGGKRMPFPGPTKKIRAPRVRPQKRGLPKHEDWGVQSNPVMRHTR